MLEYFLDDVNDFLSNFCNSSLDDDGDESIDCGQVPKVVDGCLPVLKAFLDHLVSREAENFQQRRHENKNSVTLTTMHQVFFRLTLLASTSLKPTESYQILDWQMQSSLWVELIFLYMNIINPSSLISGASIHLHIIYELRN